MNMVPRYNFPPGTEVTLFTQKMAMNRQIEAGYEFTNLETGNISVVPFCKFAELLKSPAVRLANADGIATSIVELRLGGLKAAEQLSEFQRNYGKFHFALCCAMDALRQYRRRDMGPRGGYLSIRDMENIENRKFVRAVAEKFLGEKVLLAQLRGGKSSDWFMYKGRTLIKCLTIFDRLGPEDDVIAGLATLDHLKGNEVQRLKPRLRMLMTQAWEEVGFDLKGSSVANVHDRLEVLVHEENRNRKLNELSPLIIPVEKTLKAHRDDLFSPTEYLLATKGERHTQNKRGRGSSDIRALIPGEMVEMDECKASLITSAKEKGYWHSLSTKDREALKDIDKQIQSRLSILVMIDIASRMPLAWVISDNPKAEATLALLRMATRDKTKEKVTYGCEGDPAPAMGIGMIKNDNGVGLRNAEVKQAILGCGADSTDVRTYASSDKPYVERIFGTTESVLLKIIHGYTGRKPGENPGYDAKKNGVLDIDELTGILTRFFVDEYPSMRHMGVGMGGRRPAEVFRDLNNTRGLFRPIDEDQRRIHLGWKEERKPNDEGVKVFSGLWYNSDELQMHADEIAPKKVSVFVDPDNVNEATVLIPGVKDVLRVPLQTTAFADLTLPQVLELMAAYRKENPDVTVIHNDRIMKTRRQRFDQLKAIGVERKLARSYSTAEECKAMGRAVFAGARVVRDLTVTDTVRPGQITSCTDGPGVFQIGGGVGIIEHQAHHDDFEPISSESLQSLADQPHDEGDMAPRSNQANDHSDEKQLRPLGRPKKEGTLL